MLVKFRAELLGAHVHVAVFTGERGFAMAKSGDLVFRENEWPVFVTGMRAASKSGFVIQFEGHKSDFGFGGHLDAS